MSELQNSAKEPANLFKSLSQQTSPIEGKTTDFSKTASTLSDENKSKLSSRFDKKTNKGLSCISEEQQSGFGSFRVHKHESIDEDL